MVLGMIALATIAVGLLVGAFLVSRFDKMHTNERQLDCGFIDYEKGHVRGFDCPCKPKALKGNLVYHQPVREE